MKENDFTKYIGRRVFIAGMNNSGKTTYIKRVLQDMPKPFIFDIMADDSTERARIKGYYGYPRYKINRDNFKDEKLITEEVNLFCDWAEKAVKKDKIETVFFDEINQYVGKHSMPRGIKNINDCQSHWGKRGMGFISATRRPAQVHTDIYGLADYRVFFYLDGQQDIDYLNRLSFGLGEKVKNLEPYHYIVVHRNSVQEYEPVDFKEQERKATAKKDFDRTEDIKEENTPFFPKVNWLCKWIK